METITSKIDRRRWIQLVIGILCMVMVANLQYGWTLFVDPIQEKFGWGNLAIQITFTVFVVTESIFVPVEGWLVERFGPRLVMLVGGLLCGLSWSINSFAESLFGFYFAQAIGGIGTGAVYGTCISNAIRWFPDKRSLAVGLTAAGFGAGSALTVLPISTLIEISGYEITFLYFGTAQGLAIYLLSFWVRVPEKDEAAILKVQTIESPRNLRPLEILRQPTFWVLYLMYVMIAAGGLIVTAQVAVIAKDLKVASIPVNFIGFTLTTLTFTLALSRILNGISRPFFEWVSHQIGRENTMLIAFLLEGVSLIGLYHYGQQPAFFILLTGAVFFFWGEIFALFPSTCTETFGTRYGGKNAALLYTAKGVAALFVPLSSIWIVSDDLGTLFYTTGYLSFAAALVGWLILRPLRTRFMRMHSS